jgi:hypothetical protein
MKPLSNVKENLTGKAFLGIASAALLVVFSLSAGLAMSAYAATSGSPSTACIQFWSDRSGESLGSPICRTTDQVDSIRVSTNGPVAGWLPIINSGCTPRVLFYSYSYQFLTQNCGPSSIIGFDASWTNTMYSFAWKTYSSKYGYQSQNVPVPSNSHQIAVIIGGPITAVSFLKSGSLVEKIAFPSGADDVRVSIS